MVCILIFDDNCIKKKKFKRINKTKLPIRIFLSSSFGCLKSIFTIINCPLNAEAFPVQGLTIAFHKPRSQPYLSRLFNRRPTQIY